MRIENNVAHYRRERGMTLRQLAEASGVAKSTISAIEHGLTVPRLDTAIPICRALGHEIEEVFALKVKK